MVTIIGIVLADLIVVSLFIYYYRKELGLTVEGSTDKPAVRKKPGNNKTVPEGVAEGRAKQRQIAPGKDMAGNRLPPGARRNAYLD